MKRKKVLIALSGGVDSSVTSILLKEQGYDLIGVTFRVFKSQNYRTNPLDQGIRDASALANKLNIPYYVIDVNKEFQNIVINNFVSEYRAGRTPNPCALCNPQIKWKNLLSLADSFDCEFIATGHYAQINNYNGRCFISKAKDEVKDQSYFLWRLNQEELKRTIFPIGKYDKEEIKQIASKKGFKTISQKKESYNICFIPEGDYRKYLKEYSESEFESKRGNFVDEKGEILGEHSGIENYTIGQRKGLEVFSIEPLYVVKIDSGQNKIVLGQKHSLVKSELNLKSLNLTKYDSIPYNIELFSKVGYKSPEIQCEINKQGQDFTVKFNKPVFESAPGQSIAFYENNDLIGGGIIE